MPHTEPALPPGDEPVTPKITLLLIEDEEAVRDAITGLLSRFGYHVLPASSVEEALVLWEAHRSTIQCIVADYQLGHRRDGISLLREFGGSKAGLVMALVSGNLSPGIIDELHGTTSIRCLPKPFQFTELLALLAEGLARRTPSSP